MRIDDETSGIPLVSTTRRRVRRRADQPARLLHLQGGLHPRRRVLPLALPARARRSSHTKRDQRTDLTGKRALLTGGRAKIGMYIALRLLRDGAHTTITTRFPKDAVRRFSALEDSADWLHRLKIVGIDLRDPTQVISLADDVAAAGHARHPDQQRLPDRTPHAGRLRAAGRGRVGSAPRRPRAAGDGHLRPDLRGPPGRHRRRAVRHRGRPPRRRVAPSTRWPRTTPRR